jgi:DNA/RNA endonuclease G (NUC1)
VGIPAYYFKVLVDLSPPGHDMISFLLPNAGSSEELLQFAITVDSLEKISAYDFFADAPDQEVIEWLEGRIEPGNWN